MRVCPRCKSEIPDEVRLCPVCGCLAVALVAALTFLLMLVLFGPLVR